MEESVFTKIIKGDIPSHKIYEDDKTLAFLDIHPFATGQTVVIPKTQVNFVWDLNGADYQALMATVQKVGKRLREVFPDKQRIGVRIEGLQTNNHAHAVVVPFDTSTEFNAQADMSAEPDHAALTALAEKLKFTDANDSGAA